MANAQGDFIWYELMTTDPDAARDFYKRVAGIAIDEKPEDVPNGVDYRMIHAPDAMMGGALGLSHDMLDGGASPGWIGYIGVDDVDTSVAALEQAGGRVHMPAHDMDGVGRMAMVTDPQGAPFYLMRGFSDEQSDVYRTMDNGHVAWNELMTSDWQAAFGFYADLVGWSAGEQMEMPEIGSYQMFDQGGQSIGGMFTVPDVPPHWLFYIAVPDIDAAHAAVGEAGGTVVTGPDPIPGDMFTIMGTDPQGAEFALVGPRK